MHHRTFLALLLPLPLAAATDGPAAPTDADGPSFHLAAGYVHARATSYLAGTTKTALPAPLTRDEGTLAVGLRPIAALELVASSGVQRQRDASGTHDARSDSVLAGEWRPLRSGGLSAGLRAEAILQGSYQPGGPTAPGPGANGGGAQAVAGWRGEAVIAWAVQAGAGMRAWSEGVPEDAVGWLRASLAPLPRLWFSAGYRHDQALSGHDYGQPGDPRDIARTAGVVDVAAAWGLPALPLALDVGAARPVLGRNKLEETALRLGLSARF
jgi:hypothetical protein